MSFRFSISGLFVFGALLVAACGGPPPPPPKIVPSLGSRVELAAGEVWLTKDSGRQRLITGAMLPREATITLGEGARALIRLGDGTGAFLRGGSEMTITEDRVILVKGELWADVPMDDRDLGHFSAGDVLVTASGAGFDLSREGDEVKVYVARGLAVVAGPGGRSEVQSGERATVKGNSQPVVEPVGFWADWTGGMADRELMVGRGGKGSGRIYGIDRANPGSPPKELQVLAQEVTTIIRDGVAHTTVDQRFFNPSSTDVEGWYWFTVPEGAAVERFAMEVNGYLVEGEMTERNQAAQAYEEAIQRAFDPALLEWVDGRTFRARIFPVPGTGERRVLLSYTELLPLAGGTYRYVYPMGGEGETRIQEFSLKVILGEEGRDYEIATLQDARVEDDASMISMRRSGFTPRSDFLLEIRPMEKVDPMRVVRYSTGGNEADYVMLRYAPEVDWSAVDEVPGDVVVVVDTSAGGGVTERQIRFDAVEAILRALSAGDRFAVVAADLAPRVVYPESGLASADEESVSRAIEKLSEIPSAGATDLGEMFNVALELVHEGEQPAVVYVGDGRPTVGETSSMELAERLRRSLGESRARLFTIAVGAEANHSLLERLSRMGGGRSFRIDTPEQTVQEALRFAGMVKTPTITDLVIDAGAGLDQEFSTVAGKISEGREVVLLARTHHELPDTITIKGRLGGKPFERKYPNKKVSGSDFGYVPSLWARMYLERLMGEGRTENRGNIISLGLSYAVMTPYTSFLVLESDQAYVEAGIQRRNRGNTWRGFEVSGATASLVSGQYQAAMSGAGGMPSAQSDGEVMPEMEESAGDYWRDEVGYYRQDKSAKEAPSAPVMDAASMAPPPAPPRPSPSPAPILTRPKSGAPGGGGGGYGKSAGYSLDDVSGSLGTTGYGRSTGNQAGEVTTKKRKAKDDRKPAPKAEPTPDEIIERALIAGARPTQSSRELFDTGVCSDASRRPLSQRRLLWSLRLNGAGSPMELARVFYSAGSQCELPRWSHQMELLDLIERRTVSAADVYGLLEQFEGQPKIQRYLRKRIIRRTLDPDLTTSLYEPGDVDWYMVRRGLAAMDKPEKRLARLRKILEDNDPEAPAGRALLVEVLLENDQVEEARAVASRLRRDELAGPMVLGTLCDLQSEVGLEDEARRTCSELVEFNENDPAARQRLGDLFLRHGWYSAAYRQYKTLVDMIEEDPAAWLKLAAAAAGMGKVDEALRIERKVSSGDGEAGPMDPRRFARLHSAAKLARMIIAARASGDEEQMTALTRNLKRTASFNDPSTIVLLQWEDFDAPLSLEVTRGDKPYTVSDRVESTQTGLVMVDLGRSVPDDLGMKIKLGSTPIRRSVAFRLITIKWDGNDFTMAEKDGVLEPKSEEIALAK